MVSRASTLVAPDGPCPLPEGWLLHVHPQGWVYFSNPSLRIVTDQDIRLPAIYELLQAQASRLNTVGEGSEIYLQVTKELSGPSDHGVFIIEVDHAHCIASYNSKDLEDWETLQKDPRALNRRQRLYWNYLSNHPSHTPLPTSAVSEAQNALLWYLTDNLISAQRSVVPFSKQECEDLGRVLKDVSDPSYSSSTAKTVFVAWFLREVCSYRDSQQWATRTLKESEALRKLKTSSSTTVHRPPPLLPVLNLIIRVFFFGIPLIYLSHVKTSSEFRGRFSNVKQNWEHYIERLVREYAHILLIATVLLSATVGILSISDILQPSKTAAILSALASLGSIIVAVVAIWLHQASTRATDSFTYMYRAQSGILGYHGHAILLSLPPVLLVWAVITFTVSILAYAMQDVRTTSQWSAWLVFSVFFVILFLVFAALYSFSGLWSFQRRTSWTSWIHWSRSIRRPAPVKPVYQPSLPKNISDIVEMV
ncbi:hypothetical protein FB45DRAFT_903547 [Roridomyces roridus]|uniref:WW domain-containing protein n=1 Tax=Roridomyces roridus TaxID=1738132 RepID=A0AAD7FTQ8_9AGAR|nr:hypothetical protein FB45DRAFT_903547 [Roridomyces roridus]